MIVIVIIAVLVIVVPVEFGGLHGVTPWLTPPIHVKKYSHSCPGVMSGYLLSGSPEQLWLLPHGGGVFSNLNKRIDIK